MWVGWPMTEGPKEAETGNEQGWGLRLEESSPWTLSILIDLPDLLGMLDGPGRRQSIEHC